MEKRSKRSAANLSEDTIIEILLRLPVKSIARFRCVCKSWNNLSTHDTSFHNMKLQHDNRMGNFKLLVTTRKENKNGQDVHNVQLRSVISDEAVKIRYPFEEYQWSDKDIQILGSCNGLICASANGHIVHVWNPCTKEYKVILSPSKPVGIQTNRNFASDYIGFGFGYDSKTCDYKFVSIFSKRKLGVSGVEIYYLGSELWKTYNSCIPYKVRTGDPGVFLKGALHWLANAGNDTRSRVILSFDMKDEIFKEIPLPEHMADSNYRFVDVLRGCLCLLSSVSKVGFEIWEMKDYGVRESWSKVFKSDQQLMTALDIPSYHYLRSAVHLPNGETLLQIRLCGDKILWYFKWQKKSTVVKICLNEKERHENRRKYRYKKYMIQMVPYQESLVSVNSGRHVGDGKGPKYYGRLFRMK